MLSYYDMEIFLQVAVCILKLEVYCSIWLHLYLCVCVCLYLEKYCPEFKKNMKKSHSFTFKTCHVMILSI